MLGFARRRLRLQLRLRLTITITTGKKKKRKSNKGVVWGGGGEFWGLGVRTDDVGWIVHTGLCGRFEKTRSTNGEIPFSCAFVERSWTFVVQTRRRPIKSVCEKKGKF